MCVYRKGIYMKKIFKIIMVLTLLVTNVTSVYALEEVTDTEVLDDVQLINEDQLDEIETFDLSSVLDTIPSVIELDMLESEALAWSGLYSSVPGDLKDVLIGNLGMTKVSAFADEVKSEVESLLDLSKYSVTTYSHAQSALGSYFFTIKEVYVTVKDLETGIAQSKAVDVTYKNSNNYNSSDYDKARASSAEIEELLHGSSSYGMNLSDFENNDYFSKYENDNVTIEKVNCGLYYEDTLYIQEESVALYFYVNDVLYCSLPIVTTKVRYLLVPSMDMEENLVYLTGLGLDKINEMLEALYGATTDYDLYDRYLSLEGEYSIKTESGPIFDTHLSQLDTYVGSCRFITEMNSSYTVDLMYDASLLGDDSTEDDSADLNITITDGVYLDGDYEGVVITSEDLSLDSTLYQEMHTYLKEKGFPYVLNAYEFSLSEGDISGGVRISFDVGNEYNGKDVFVLHKTQSEEYEEFIVTAANGKITIEVSELSPFMLAVEEVVEITTPNTSDTSVMLFSTSMMLLVASLFVMKRTIVSK